MARTKQVARKETTPKKVEKAAAEIKKPEIKKPHRYRPGTVALRRIHKEQKKYDSIVRTSPLRRLMRERLNTDLAEGQKGFHLSPSAVAAMSEIVDSTLLKLLHQSQKVASHNGDRITIFPKDVKLAADLTGVKKYL
uniref:Histone H3 n=1 Tax=Clandestinovirus TaxID=2831644 RepID=A0A8F8KM53_9VIRU|nr:histone H3 [Clandestinovirus]